jgi:hypothetical protein
MSYIQFLYGKEADSMSNDSNRQALDRMKSLDVRLREWLLQNYSKEHPPVILIKGYEVYVRNTHTGKLFNLSRRFINVLRKSQKLNLTKTETEKDQIMDRALSQLLIQMIIADESFFIEEDTGHLLKDKERIEEMVKAEEKRRQLTAQRTSLVKK